ncbi:MAG TPA: helical backbone metal receptor [Bryobacteraceae bacterium]|nr:helical backbone metal receptor [Bryobacteraceae bacterium]
MRLIVPLLLAVNLWGAGAQRIVSTAPRITESLFAMGLGPRVVGVTIYCKYPEEALKLPKIGTLLKPDVEAIVALRPDLVVVSDQHGHLAEQLSRLHIPSVEMQSQNLDAIYAGVRAIGKAAGAVDAAERMIQGMQSQLQSIAQRTAGQPKPTVAFIVGHTAGRLEGLVAGGGSSYFSDLLRYAGGINIFADVVTPYPKISLEEILSRDPDVIMELSGDTRPKQEEVLALWQSKRSLKAVRSGRVYALESTPFIVPGPRAVEAVKQILRLLHPEMP